MTGPRQAEPEREILTVDEAALLLCVSVKTFQKVLREGQVPGRKIGREWKFSRRALIEWVGRGRSAEYLDLDDDGDVARPVDSEPRAKPVRAQHDGVARMPVKKRADHEMAFEED